MSAKLSPRTQLYDSPPPAQRRGGVGGPSASTNFPPPRLALEGARRPSSPLRGGRASNDALLESGWSKVAAVSIAVAIASSAATSALAQSLDEKVQLCAACHGENGVPQDKSVPVISGQHQGYLYLQLRDYKSGSRKNEIMSPIAEGLERDDMMQLAEHLSKQKWPDLRQPPASPQAAATAQRLNVSIGCTGCHQGEYQGEGTQPRLAGQTREYLEGSMLAFRDGTRGNNPGMSDLMKAASVEDLKACAEYLASLSIIGR
jgi:cytochrome c553